MTIVITDIAGQTWGSASGSHIHMSCTKGTKKDRKHFTCPVGRSSGSSFRRRYGTVQVVCTAMLILSRFESCVSYKTQCCDSIISDHNYWKLELSEYFRDTKCIDVHVGYSILGPGPTVDEIRYTCSVHAGIAALPTTHPQLKYLTQLQPGKWILKIL